MKLTLRTTGFLLLPQILFSCYNNQQSEPPNVLFICVDDLRPELNCYGNSIVKSPNLDKLASEGCIFTNHFANVPTCGASRLCLLTGNLPKNFSQISNEAIRSNISRSPVIKSPETFIHHLRINLHSYFYI